MEDPNGAEETKGGTEGEQESGAKEKPKKSEASSPKTYTQEEVDKLIKDKENALKGAEGWEVKKLQKEVETLQKEAADEKAKRKEIEFNRVAEKYGVDIDKAKEEGFDDPVVLEKALKVAGKTPISTIRLDSGRTTGSGKLSWESVDKMSPEELNKLKKEHGVTELLDLINKGVVVPPK